MSEKEIKKEFDGKHSVLVEGLLAARHYVNLDARNKKYPLAVSTLVKIDAAIAAIGVVVEDGD